MNDDDSDQMARMLQSLGYEIVDDCDEADLVILNTCSVRAKPEQKVRTKLGELRIQKLRNPAHLKTLLPRQIATRLLNRTKWLEMLSPEKETYRVSRIDPLECVPAG